MIHIQNKNILAPAPPGLTLPRPLPTTGVPLFPHNPPAAVVPPTDPRLLETSTLLAQALARSSPRRPRGEKKPIPEEQKDQRYYERRKRNNLAAKKSRDQRKMREDAIGMRATYLEKENAILRTQVATLREERNSLQSLLLRRQLHQKQRAMINLFVEQQQKQYLELIKHQQKSALELEKSREIDKNIATEINEDSHTISSNNDDDVEIVDLRLNNNSSQNDIITSTKSEDENSSNKNPTEEVDNNIIISSSNIANNVEG